MTQEPRTQVNEGTDDVTTSRGMAPGHGRVGWPEVGVAVGVAVVLYAIGIAIIWAVNDGAPQVSGIVQYLVSGLAPLGGFAAAVAWRVRDLSAFGFRRVSGRWIGLSIAAGVLAIGLNIAATVVYVLVVGLPEHLQADYQAAATGGLGFFLLALLAGAVLTPLGEEVLFRGVLANALARYGPWVAVLGSSAVFALAHGINHILPVAFIVGIIAVLLFRRTGSIWPAVIVHAVNNGYSVVAPAVAALVS